jgi:hypothetical protein
MDYIPNSAIVMAISLLIVIWGFLAYMILSQGTDAHLEFLFRLTREIEERPEDSQPLVSPPLGSSAGLPALEGAGTLHDAAFCVADETPTYSLYPIKREVPLLFATSIRGRGL